MAGGGGVIQGGGGRGAGNVANVTGHALWVQIVGSSPSNPIWVRDAAVYKTLSGAVGGIPKLITNAGPTVIHTVDDTFEMLSLWCSNPNDVDDTLLLRWTASPPDLPFFVPARETVPIVHRAVQQAVNNSFRCTSTNNDLYVFGYVEQFNHLFTF